MELSWRKEGEGVVLVRSARIPYSAGYHTIPLTSVRTLSITPHPPAALKSSLLILSWSLSRVVVKSRRVK